jgi:hypothetical protein
VSKFIDISVDEASIKRVTTSFEKYGVAAAKALMNAIYRTALSMESDAKLRLNGKLGSARHWVTGRLASSVHAETNAKNSFKGINESEPSDGSFGVPIDDLEALIGTNVVYGPKIEFEYDSFIQFAATKQSPELPKRIEKELNKLADKFNK